MSMLFEEKLPLTIMSNMVVNVAAFIIFLIWQY